MERRSCDISSNISIFFQVHSCKQIRSSSHGSKVTTHFLQVTEDCFDLGGENWGHFDVGNTTFPCHGCRFYQPAPRKTSNFTQHCQVLNFQILKWDCGWQCTEWPSKKCTDETHSLSLTSEQPLKDPRGTNVEVRREDLANWALWTSLKFIIGVKYQFHEGFWPDQRSRNPNHPSPPDYTGWSVWEDTKWIHYKRRTIAIYCSIWCIMHYWNMGVLSRLG